MKPRITLALAACAAAIGMLSGIPSNGLRAAEPKDKDVAAMQGAWTIESFTLDGNTIDPEQLKSWRRIVKNNHVVWKDGDRVLLETDIKFDPSKKPLTLDSTIASGEDKGKVLLAIYELKDDVLRVCFAHPDKPRPTEFSSKPDSGQSVFTAKRGKPEAK